jgi:hypothetical protein
MTPTLRASKEVARRGLYSRFFRGKALEPEEAKFEIENVPAGNKVSAGNRSDEPALSIPNGVKHSESEKRKGKRKSREGETEEERRTRRAEKKRLKKKTDTDGVTGLQDGDLCEEDAQSERRAKRKGDGRSKKRKKVDLKID